MSSISSAQEPKPAFLVNIAAAPRTVFVRTFILQEGPEGHLLGLLFGRYTASQHLSRSLLSDPAMGAHGWSGLPMIASVLFLPPVLPLERKTTGG